MKKVKKNLKWNMNNFSLAVPDVKVELGGHGTVIATDHLGPDVAADQVLR